MSTKSREVIFGSRIAGARIRAEGARKRAKQAVREADRAEAEAWSIRMEATQACSAVASDRATLFPSPMNATVLSSNVPKCSSTVIRSAIAWQGWL